MSRTADSYDKYLVAMHESFARAMQQYVYSKGVVMDPNTYDKKSWCWYPDNDFKAIEKEMDKLFSKMGILK